MTLFQRTVLLALGTLIKAVLLNGRAGVELRDLSAAADRIVDIGRQGR